MVPTDFQLQRPYAATVPDDEVVRTCSYCGTQATAPEGGIPEGWSMVTERKRVEYQCVTCVRSNIRSIEGKLPEEYWEF
jgi:hypothetical protein